MTDKLEVGQLRIWRDWAHTDSVFAVVELSQTEVFYRYIDETDMDQRWQGDASRILKNTMPCTKLHRLLMGMTD
jgi:L-rhamnose mutarotase